MIVIGMVTGLQGCRDKETIEPRSSLSSDSSYPMYAITTATPGKNKNGLKENHKGYQQADCLFCHKMAHDSSYRPSDCAGCHGNNGAPLRAVDHPNVDCVRCHDGSHVDDAFVSPHECVSCHLYSAPPQSCTATGDYDVVIVGAGGGGLAAGATLSRAGLKVLLVERNSRAGGYMTNYRRGDFRFETSLHGFDGLDPVYGINASLLKNLDIADKVRPIRAEPFLFRVSTAHKNYDIPSDINKFQEMLSAEFPAEKVPIDRLFKDIMDLGRIIRKAHGAEKNWLGLPQGLSLLELGRLYWLEKEPASRYFNRFVRDPELLAVLGQLIGFLAVPFDRTSALLGVGVLYTYHAGGYYYFEGGSQALTDALVKVLESHGGTIRFNETVTKIQLTGGRATGVKTSGGSCYKGRYVISNANAQSTMLDMVGRNHLPEKYWKNLEKMTPSISAFVINLGINADLRQQFGNTHEIMVPDKKGVSDVSVAAHCALDSVGYGIGNFSMIDPTMSPPGTTSLAMIVPATYECFERWGYRSATKSPLQVKQEIAEVFIKRLDKMFPGIREKIVVADIMTPVTLHNYTLSPAGALNGFAYTREQSMTNRLSQITPIENLYLAGAWTTPGGGQSMVLTSGLNAAKIILKKEHIEIPSPPEP
jgi:prolycopene isomerase